MDKQLEDNEQYVEEDHVDLDHILTAIGIGRWHFLIFFINILIWAVHGPHTMGSTLFNAPVNFICFYSIDDASQFLSTTETRNLSISYDSKCLDSTEFALLEFRQRGDNFSGSFRPSEMNRVKLIDQASCPVVLYDSSVYSDTVTTDWNLICDSSMKRPLFQNIYSLGIIMGCFLVGPISDGVGRARAIVIGSVIHIFSSSLVVIGPLYSISLAARLVVGISNILILISAVTYAVENCPVSWRGPVGTFIGMPYSLWVVVFAVIAFYVRNWSHLYIAVSLPAIFLLPSAMALEESPRWLLQQGMKRQAYTILLRAAIKNNASNETKQLLLRLQEQNCEQNIYEFGRNNLTSNDKIANIKIQGSGNSLELSMQAPSGIRPAQFELNIESPHPEDNSGDGCNENCYSNTSETISLNFKADQTVQLCYELDQPSGKRKLPGSCVTKTNIIVKKVKAEIVPFYMTPFMRRITIVAFIAKFLCEFVYYGVLFNTNNFASGNPFLYVGLSGIADAVAVIVGVVTSKTLSRKLTIGGGFLASGMLLIVVLVIPKSWMILQWIFVLSGFLMIAVASQVFFVYLPELFPTTLRGKGFAICNSAGNIGILFAPLMSDVLGEKIWWGPSVFLGCSGLIASLLIVLLPETKDRKMCETVIDVENRAYGKLEY